MAAEHSRAAPPARRIWSELLPLAEIRAPRVLGLLCRYGLELAVAVRPDTAAELPDLALACRDAGVPLAVWPMLADEEGRWPSAGNAPEFSAFALRVTGALAAASAPPREVVFDLEPPIDLVREALAGVRGIARLLLSGADRAAFASGARHYAELSARLTGEGIEVSAAVLPFLLWGAAWERALGTPASAVSWAHVSVMLYTSMIEGWSRGWLRRSDAVSLLARGCRGARKRHGDRAGVSLGAVGKGAFGDEPVYRGVHELREDVAVATAAGIDRLALFDLGGVLSRPPAEAWLDAFVEPPVR